MPKSHRSYMVPAAYEILPICGRQEEWFIYQKDVDEYKCAVAETFTFDSDDSWDSSQPSSPDFTPEFTPPPSPRSDTSGSTASPGAYIPTNSASAGIAPDTVTTRDVSSDVEEDDDIFTQPLHKHEECDHL